MGVATVVNVHLGNEGDTEKQVTGLLSLLEDLRAGDRRTRGVRTKDLRKRDLRTQEDVRRQQQRIPQTGNQRRRGLRRGQGEEEEEEEEEEGDFNFESTSSGYRRMVSEGGLQSAANISTEAAAAESTDWYSPATAPNSPATTPDYPAMGSTFPGMVPKNFYYTAPNLADDGVVPEKREVLPRIPGHGGAAAGRVASDPHGDDALGAGSSGGGSVVDDIVSDDGDVVGGVSARGGGDGNGRAGGDGGAGAAGVAGGAAAADGEGGNEIGDTVVAGGTADNSGALDFVFLATEGGGSGGGGISCRSYEVHREFSQERYADGYPSVAEFEVSCPSLAVERDQREA
ncbi:unnamed protein product [Ectocarpus fasciculatus]